VEEDTCEEEDAYDEEDTCTSALTLRVLDRVPCLPPEALASDFIC
jgi:hypothetical protein